MKTKKELESAIMQKMLNDHAFRQEVIDNPKVTIEKKMGIAIPDGVKVRLIEEKADEIVLVIPQYNDPGEELNTSDLESVAGGWSGSSDCGTCDACTDNNCTIGGC